MELVDCCQIQKATKEKGPVDGVQIKRTYITKRGLTLSKETKMKIKPHYLNRILS